jgi:hypothetical protein
MLTSASLYVVVQETAKKLRSFLSSESAPAHVPKLREQQLSAFFRPGHPALRAESRPNL